MADFTTKPVEEVTVGDALWSISPSGEPVPSIVSAHGSRRAGVRAIKFWGPHAALHATSEHPVLTSAGWKPAAGLTPGDLALLVKGNSAPTRWSFAGLALPPHGSVVHPNEMAEFLDLMRSPPATVPSWGWARVKSVTEEDPVEPVFSFECVPFHNYVADDALVHNCRYCFAPGTLVLTEQGHIPIETIFANGTPSSNPEVRTVGDREALTHRGRWRQVRQAFRHMYSGSVLTVKPYYLPGFRCTPDHEVFAAVAGQRVGKVRAKDLKIGDFLAIPRPEPEASHPIDMATFLEASGSPKYKYRYTLRRKDGRVRWSSEKGPGVPARIRLSPEFARLVGYYCAEGSVSWHRKRPNSGSVWFSFGHMKTDRISEVRELVDQVLGLRSRISVQESRAAVVVSSSPLAKFLQETCGASSQTKRVPAFILRSTDPAVLLGFLAGYLNGDGNVTRG